MYLLTFFINVYNYVSQNRIGRWSFNTSRNIISVESRPPWSSHVSNDLMDDRSCLEETRILSRTYPYGVSLLFLKYIYILSKRMSQNGIRISQDGQNRSQYPENIRSKSKISWQNFHKSWVLLYLQNRIYEHERIESIITQDLQCSRPDSADPQLIDNMSKLIEYEESIQ